MTKLTDVKKRDLAGGMCSLNERSELKVTTRLRAEVDGVSVVL